AGAGGQAGHPAQASASQPPAPVPATPQLAPAPAAPQLAPAPLAASSPPRAAPAMLLAVLVLAAALAAFRPVAVTGPHLLYERTTPYQTLVVSERAGVRYLESDRVMQAAVLIADGETAMRYPRVAAASLLLNPHPRSLLELG